MIRWLARSMVVVLLLAAGCGDTPAPVGIQDRTFSDPFVKLAQTADATFAAQLHAEAVALDPVLSRSGTQVHMGFWSGSGIRAALVALLDSINGAPLAPGEPPRRAVWVDPHPVTFDQADLVWSQYSERYAEMAADFLRDTGVKVKAWCFVEGAGTGGSTGPASGMGPPEPVHS